MSGREKRLGRQTAVVADIEFPNFPVTVASIHLDAQSTQRHRHDQMRDVLDGLATDRPTIIGGDWNTTTYNSSRAFDAIMGFWLRVFMGVDNVINNHYLHPYNYFEKDLFGLLEARGFDYRQSNILGERTASYDAEDIKTNKNLREWVPAWCFAFIRWALRNHDGKGPLKIDLVCHARRPLQGPQGAPSPARGPRSPPLGPRCHWRGFGCVMSLVPVVT